MKWKIFYGDGTTFSNEDGDFCDAPPWNIQCIAEANEDVGRTIHAFGDFYIFRDGRWFGVDWFGLCDFLIENGLVKFGRTVPSPDFHEIYVQADNDPDFPARSGYLRDEWHGKSN